MRCCKAASADLYEIFDPLPPTLAPCAVLRVLERRYRADEEDFAADDLSAPRWLGTVGAADADDRFEAGGGDAGRDEGSAGHLVRAQVSFQDYTGESCVGGRGVVGKERAVRQQGFMPESGRPAPAVLCEELRCGG